MDLSSQHGIERADRDLHGATRAFARQLTARSWWYVGSTFTLLGGALAGAALAPWWPLRLAASILEGLLLVRTFILYHDFMHGAILPGSRLARAFFYLQRLRYRVVRHPATILCAYLTIFLFSVCLLPLVRRPSRYWDSAMSLLAHGMAVASLWIFAGFDVLFFALLLPMSLAAAMGGYLFYAQHSFPGMRILPDKEWTTYRAALVSSSYLRLGPVIRWFTGNIGFHHVHHLNSLRPRESGAGGAAARGFGIRVRQPERLWRRQGL